MNSNNTINAKFGLDLNPLQTAAIRATQIATAMAMNVRKAMMPASRALSLLGVALTGAGLIAGAKNILHVAGHMQTLHEQTNVSVNAIALLEQSFEDADSSVEALGRSIFMMQRNLQSKKGLETLQAMHISLDALKQMSPEQIFVMLGRRIAEVQDPAAQLNLAMKLFGFQGRRLLSVFKDSAFGNPSVAMRAQAEILFKNAALFDEVGDRMNHLLKIGRGFFLGAMEKVAPLLLAVIKKLETIDIVEKGRAFGNLILMAIKTAAGIVAGWIQVGREVYKLWVGASKLLGSGGQALLAAIDEALPMWASMREILIIAALEFTQWLGKGVYDAASVLSGAFQDILDQASGIFDLFKSSGAALSEPVVQTVSQLNTAVGELMQDIQNVIMSIGGDLATIATAFRDILMGAGDSFIAMLYGGFKTIVAFFAASLQFALDKVLTKMSKIPGLGSLAPKSQDTFAKTFANMRSGISAGLGGIDQEMADKKTNGASRMARGVGNLKDAGTNSASQILKMINHAKDRGVNFASQIAQTLNKVWETTKTTAKGLLDKAMELMDAMGKGTWANGAINDAKGRLKEIWSKVMDAGQKLVTNAVATKEGKADGSHGFQRAAIGGPWGHVGWKSAGLHMGRTSGVSFVKKRGESMDHFEKRKQAIRDGVKKAAGKEDKKASLETTNDLLSGIKQTMEDAWN